MDNGQWTMDNGMDGSVSLKGLLSLGSGKNEKMELEKWKNGQLTMDNFILTSTESRPRRKIVRQLTMTTK
jgi:hypothetical protein